jgi:hypothetical protein
MQPYPRGERLGRAPGWRGIGSGSGGRDRRSAVRGPAGLGSWTADADPDRRATQRADSNTSGADIELELGERSSRIRAPR